MFIFLSNPVRAIMGYGV